jgi:hypothetical protein
MNIFLDILKFIFIFVFTIVITVAVLYWFTASLETLRYVKRNNVLLNELCVENGINVDSVLNAAQNDTLNLKVDTKGE